MVDWSTAERLKTLNPTDFALLSTEVFKEMQERGYQTPITGPWSNVDELYTFSDKVDRHLDGRFIAELFASDPRPHARAILGALMGKPIYVHVPTDPRLPPLPKQRAQAPPPGSRRPKHEDGYRDGRIITLVSAANPKQAGSASHRRFGFYKTGMTVQDFLDAGGTKGDLKWDAAKNYISIGKAP